MNNIALAVDLEIDQGRVIEIGVTSINLKKRMINNTYSIPLKVDWEISKSVKDLTGWTTAKLNKQGVTKQEAVRRLYDYGAKNNLLITDTDDEIEFLDNQLCITPFFETAHLSKKRLNVAVLYQLAEKDLTNKGLDDMLNTMGIVFEGQRHRANWDSLAIARLFLALT